MKSSEIKIDTALNEKLWNRGITKPPRRITVKMEKDEDGIVTISLPKKEKIEATEEAVETKKAEGEKDSESTDSDQKASTATTVPKSTKRKAKPKD